MQFERLQSHFQQQRDKWASSVGRDSIFTSFPINFRLSRIFTNWYWNWNKFVLDAIQSNWIIQLQPKRVLQPSTARKKFFGLLHLLSISHQSVDITDMQSNLNKTVHIREKNEQFWLLITLNWWKSKWKNTKRRQCTCYIQCIGMYCWENIHSA